MNKVKKQVEILNPSVICVVESWLCEAVPDAAISIPTYNVIRSDYRSVNPSGGLIIYCHESLHVSIINIDEFPNCVGSEILVLSVQSKYNKTFLLTVL